MCSTTCLRVITQECLQFQTNETMPCLMPHTVPNRKGVSECRQLRENKKGKEKDKDKEDISPEFLISEPDVELQFQVRRVNAFLNL